MIKRILSKRMSDGTLKPVEVTRTVTTDTGHKNVYTDLENCRSKQQSQSLTCLAKVDSLKSLTRSDSRDSIVITGLQYHNDEDKIVLKRLGCNKNIRVTMLRKEKHFKLNNKALEIHRKQKELDASKERIQKYQDNLNAMTRLQGKLSKLVTQQTNMSQILENSQITISKSSQLGDTIKTNKSGVVPLNESQILTDAEMEERLKQF